MAQHGPIIETPSTEVPVTLEEAKTYCLIDPDNDGDDETIEGFIIGATDYVQRRVGQQFMEVSVTQTWDCFDDWQSELRLDRRPVQSVTFVKYYDVNGTLTTISASNYHVSLNSRPPRIIPVTAYTWPDTQLGRPEVVVVEYVAGYDDPDSIPRPLIVAIKALTKHWYDNRGVAIVTGAVPQDIPYTLEAMLDMYDEGGYR